MALEPKIARRNVLFGLGAVGALVAANLIIILFAARSSDPRAMSKLFPTLISLNIALLFLLGLMRAVKLRVDHDLARARRDCESQELISTKASTETMVLETLSDVSESFMERMRLQPLLDRMSQAMQEIVEADVSVIELFPGSESEERVQFLKGVEHISLGEELYNKVIYEGKSTLINNLANYPRYGNLGEQGMTAMVIAPLQVRDKVIGLVGALSQTGKDFTGRDLSLLHTFASHAALLIESTQLLDAVRRLSVKSESDDIYDLQHLKERLSFERELADREMDVARQIQSDLLPKHMPEIRDLGIEAINIPARDVGGDYYDFFELEDGRWGFAIADVAGKGVPAALVMVMSRTILRMSARESSSPARVLAGLDDLLFEETSPQMFVSMFYGIWRPGEQTVTYANAGHERPFVYRADDHTCRRLDEAGVALGAAPGGHRFLSDHTVRLGSGDVLLLYTDGVTEALNKQNDMFTLSRLEQLIQSDGWRSASAVVERIATSLNEFSGGAAQFDDVTLLALRAG